MNGIIFDLDGVITSTDSFHYKAWKALADELQIEFNEEINNRLRGVSRMESLEIILEKSDKKYTDEEKIAFSEKKNTIYKEYLRDMDETYLDIEVKETLDALRNKGLKLAIGSSSKNAKFILKQIGLDGYFDEIADGNDIKNSKPDPEVFVLAAEKLSLAPSECIVVEDAYAGVDAAINGGFLCIAIGDAYKYDRATHKILSFIEILNIV